MINNCTLKYLATGKANKSKKLNKGEISTFEEANESKWERLLKEGMLSNIAKKSRRRQKITNWRKEEFLFFNSNVVFFQMCLGIF